MSTTKSKKWLYPLVLAAVGIICFMIGRRLNMGERVYAENDEPSAYISETDSVSRAYRKIIDIVSLVSSRYVDTINTVGYVEKFIPKMLESLDPHTSYIAAEDLQLVNDDLAASFFGIGVQFNVMSDTVNVVQVISGGPSQKVGIRAGDKIVLVDDSTFTGSSINNEMVVRKLRGPKDTHVKLGIKRPNVDEILSFDVVRGEIPQETVDCRYMIDKQTGYVKVDRFGEKTAAEFYEALRMLEDEGAKRFVVDLRGNGGGYIGAATNMLNLLLDKGDLMVYTCARGQNDKNEGETYIANGKTPYNRVPIVVLVDNNSASASEIFAGAIQDNDRGLVVGRRTFGKGLVQQQFNITGGAAIRLTIARYHTPSGRCIQKHYGEGYDYGKEIEERITRGELLYADSMLAAAKDSLEYKTLKLGRTVYAGGGIVPDVFVGIDSTLMTPYIEQTLNKGMVYEYACNYIDSHRTALLAYEKDYNKLYTKLINDHIFDQFTAYATSKGIAAPTSKVAETKKTIERFLTSYIVRGICGRDECGDRPFYSIYNKDDKFISAALKAFDSEEMKQINAR